MQDEVEAGGPSQNSQLAPMAGLVIRLYHYRRGAEPNMDRRTMAFVISLPVPWYKQTCSQVQVAFQPCGQPSRHIP